jgi:membrane protein implicated in regulation of membrane protease activity
MIFILTLIVVVLANIGGPWAVALLIAAAIAEVGEIVLLRRWAKRLDRRYRAHSPEEQLVGLVAEVITPCRPQGQVRVRGEIWEALCPAGAPQGSSVRVERVEALLLHVSPTT